MMISELIDDYNVDIYIWYQDDVNLCALAICDGFQNRDQGGDIGGNLPPDYDSSFSFS